MRKKIKLNILGLSYSRTQSGAYALVLSEEDGPRRIPIIIGNLEAQSIAIKIEGLQPSRPLTHDLFFSFAQSFNVEILEVTIYKLEEGIFYSELICAKENEVVHIDSRTSDAIAIALRFGCPIYTYDDIIEQSGIILDLHSESTQKQTSEPENEEDENEEDESDPKDQNKSLLSNKSKEELETLLEEAVSEENYEFAGLIQNEIAKREEEK